MKNISVLLVAIALAFTACGGGGGDSEPGSGEQFTVRFDLGYQGAPAIADITVESGKTAGSSWPANPVRQDQMGLSFAGWFDDDDTLYTAGTAITKTVTVKAKWSTEVSILEDQPDDTTLTALFADNLPSDLSNSWKIYGHHNAVITQGFSADPTVMVYNNKAYLFASNDSLVYDASGEGVVEPSYAVAIQGIRSVSSADLANWTDHGVIKVGLPDSTNPLIPDVPPLASFETRSWAPSAAWKMIGGRPRFFVYYCNSGNGIGVITADSPTGPWRSPLSKLLIDRNTPNCSDVQYLFDPGVFVDDDGQAYLYFGGGQDGVPADNTGQARRVKLGPDMISLAGTPQTYHVPYLFEASDMFKYKGNYYLSYCTNWNTTGNSYGLQNCQIAYMMDSDPMGTFGSPRGILNSPQSQLASSDNNNHQNLFIFNNEVYIAYHASKVAQAMGLGFRYRSTFIDKVTINADGVIQPITMTRKGVEQIGNLNPYVPNEAETIGVMGGIYTRAESGASNGMVVTSIDTGDWVALYGVNFGSTGAKKFTARIRTPETPADYVGAIELRIDPQADGITGDTGNLSGSATTRIKGGTVIGRVYLKAQPGEEGKYTTVTVDLNQTVTGIKDLVFVFYSSLGVRPETITRDSPHKKAFEFDQWQFFTE